MFGRNFVRLCSTRFSGVRVMEVSPSGESKERILAVEEVLKIQGTGNKRLPLRDLRVFFSTVEDQAGDYPSILTRPSSKCYLLDLLNLKILCRSDRCFLLHPESSAVRSFLHRLRKKTNSRVLSSSSFADAFLGQEREIPFEQTVLETALADITRKFHRRSELITPMLNILLNETSKNPDASMLRRLLAFRKSLSSFHVDVERVRYAVSSVLKVDEDMEALYLTSPPEPGCHEEIEFMLEAFEADLRDIENRITNMKTMIEETNDFINTHLNTLRNKIMRMSLFMEIGTLSAGTGALIGGLFGMNLTNGIEEHPTAFFFITGGTGILMLGIFTTFAMKYRSLRFDTSGARSYQALKNFFVFVDSLEMSMRMSDFEKFDKNEFRSLLQKVVGPELEDKEVDLIFKMLDLDRSGYIELGEFKRKK